jgi:sarcosine oxidase subunit gamma
MPETTPSPRDSARRLGPLAGVALPERRAAEGEVGILLGVPAAPSIVTAEARRGRLDDMAGRIAGRFGGMPAPLASLGEDPRVLHTGPGALVFVAEGRPEGALAGEVRDLLGETAAVVDQSHGRTLIRLGGPRARDLLAYGTGIDLAPEAFGPGACAATTLGHIAATLHLRKPAPEVDLIVARAFAESLWDWLLGRARRFGYEVTG